MMPANEQITILPLVLALLVAGIWNCGNDSAVMANPLPGNDLKLSLSSPGANSQQVQSNGVINSVLMEQITNDNLRDDFELSASLMNQMRAMLEEFGQQAKLPASDAPISSWLASNGVQPDRLHMTKELDLVYRTLWTEFIPIVEKILTKKPPTLTKDNLDFRCTAELDLKKLRDMGAASGIYSLYLETFFSELYQHCLMRKLAMIRLNGASPSALVTQFVDIYLDLPVRNPSTAASKEVRDHIAGRLLAGHALSFNLQQAIVKVGPLEQMASLTFDSGLSLSMGSMDPNEAKRVVQNFKQDCFQHAKRLSEIWGNFDDVATLLSSETSNLAEFNRKVKLAAPQLVYATICSQLTTLA